MHANMKQEQTFLLRLQSQVQRPSVRNFRATSVSASAGHGSNQIAVVQLTSEGYIPEIHSQRHRDELEHLPFGSAKLLQ